MAKQKPLKIFFFDTYLAMIQNSVGSKMFRAVYALIDKKKINIIENGRVACALYVSSLLVINKLIGEIHATVDSTIIALEKAGWEKISKPRIGCIIVWEKVDFGKNDLHKHIGFYIGNQEAISNSSKKGYPVKHNVTFNDKRKIELLLWHPKLKN
jgi:hypothetical protein